MIISNNFLFSKYKNVKGLLSSIQWNFFLNHLQKKMRLKLAFPQLKLITCANLFKYLNSYSPGLCLGMNFPARVKTAFTSPSSIRLTTSNFSLMTSPQRYSM